MADKADENNAVMPRLIPRGKIAIPVVSPRSDANGTSSSFAPASEKAGQQPKEDEASRTTAAEEAAPNREVRPAFQPISPGLSSVALPLGPGPKVAVKREAEQAPAPEKVEEPAVEAKVGDLVELFMGRGQVRAIREDGLLEVLAMGWEMTGEQRARYYVRRDSVKVVPTVYYQMTVLERLEITAWLKEQGGKMFKAAKYREAAECYMKAIGILKTCEFTSNAQNARALEVMIPCHNNAATCYIKLKNYGDAKLLSENVDTLCSALERNRGGKVMKALKERGIGETTILGQWWCKGLFLGGKACLFQSEHDQAVACLKKGSKLAKPAALAKLRTEINNELDKATKRLASQTKKAQKMWTKAFTKNSTDMAPDEDQAKGRGLPAAGLANGAPQTSILQRLEELAKMSSAPAAPEPKKFPKEEEEEESEAQSEEESESEDGSEDESQVTAVSSNKWLWGSIAVGVTAASVAALVHLAKRR